jgi:arylsulfatase A-like enzyme
MSRCLLLVSFIALLAVAPTLAVAEPDSELAASAPRPNLLLITLDTTRADHLGAYGYERATSPRLDAMADDAVVFDRAYSTSSWTLPAHASLLTGQYPTTHGALYDRKGALGLGDGIQGSEKALARYRVNPLSTHSETLAERLAAAGYATGAVVAGPWMMKVFGLGRGFESYDDDEISMQDSTLSSVRGRLASQVSERALAFIEEQAAQPFFLFLNFYDPHLPFGDPHGLASLFFPGGASAYPRPKRFLSVEEETAYYDGEIRYMDRYLGRIFERLKELGLYERTWIIVTADHGELFREQATGIGHGKSLYQGEVRIPLIIKYPNGEAQPGRSDRLVQLTDILPMVTGRLIDSATPSKGLERERVFAEVRPSQLTASDDDWSMILSGEYKLLISSSGKVLLFDLSADPLEEKNLAGEEPERVAAMRSELESFQSALPVAKPAEASGQVDEATRRALESLGYLE